MADSNSQILEILLKLRADVADSSKVTGALKEIEAQGTRTAAAVSSVGATSSSGTPIDWNRIANERANAMAVINGQDEQAVVSAEAQAAAQAKIALQMERRVIMETEIEAAEARIAGNPALATRLEREAQIRVQSLSIQRALNISTEEAIVLAEKMVLAQETQGASSALVGANLNKAKGEAIVLARELATGSVNMRTMGAFLGSLGTTLTIAGIAGFGLFEVISHMADEMERLEKETAKESEDLFKQIDQWQQLAKTAGNFSDELKLGEKIDSQLDTLAAKLEAFRQKQETGWSKFRQQFFDVATQSGMNEDGTLSPDAAATDMQAKIVQKGLEAGLKSLGIAEQSKQAWDSIQLEPVAQGIEDVTRKIEDLEAECLSLKELTVLPPDATPGQIAAAVHALDDEIKALQQKAIWEERLKGLNKTQQQEDKQVATDAERARHQQLNNVLAQQKLLFDDIKRAQDIISQNPYLSAQAKEDLLHNEYLREQAQLLVGIKQTELEIAQLKLLGNTGDLTRITELIEKLHQLNFQLDTTKFKIKQTTPIGGIQSDLANWVNSWGAASHQIANTLQSSIGSGLQGLNQYLVTGQGNVQQLMQQFETMGLQLLEQMAIQEAASLLHITTTTTAQVASGGAIAAAHAPAAAATSISSYGSAAVIGEILAIAAIVAIMAALGGGFKRGGYTGDGDPNQPAGLAHKKEFYFTADEVDALGLPFLQSLADAAGGTAVIPSSLRHTNTVGLDPGPEGPPAPGPTIIPPWFSDPSSIVPNIVATGTPGTPAPGAQIPWWDYSPWGGGRIPGDPTVEVPTSPYSGLYGAGGGPGLTSPTIRWPTSGGLNPGDSSPYIPTAADLLTYGAGAISGPDRNAGGSSSPTFGDLASLGYSFGPFAEGGTSLAGAMGWEDFFPKPALLRAAGGPIFGGSGLRDDIPILGMHGEFMLNRGAVELNGLSNIHALNNRSISIPQLRSSVSTAIVSPLSRAASGQNSQPINVHVFYFNDERDAIRRFRESPESRKFFRRNGS
jgi:hypothetical protein